MHAKGALEDGGRDEIECEMEEEVKGGEEGGLVGERGSRRP